MSFHGGAIGVFVAGLAFARFKKIDALRLGDLIVAAEPIGGFLVRLANFVNGELWGRPTTLPWGMVFPDAGPLPRHPSQLYEAALEGLLMFCVLRWATHGKRWLNRRGVVLGMFLVGYGLIRISLENVRQPDDWMPHFPLGLTMGMMLSTPMVLIGAWLIWRGLKEPLPPAIEAGAVPQGAHEPALAAERAHRRRRPDQRRPVHDRLPARPGLRLLRHAAGPRRSRRLHHRAHGQPDVRRAADRRRWAAASWELMGRPGRAAADRDGARATAR